jgi:membrane protein required for colicin V production
MNILDIIFLVLIAASVIYSLVKGLVAEIFSFLAIILGFLAASYGYSRAAEWLKGWVGHETLSSIIAFAFLFLLVAIAVSLLGRLIHKGGLGWADRMGGAAFGFLKAVLLIAILLLVLTAFLPPQSKVLLESKISPAALTIAGGLSFLVPEKFQRLYAEKEKELKKYWALRDFLPDKPETKGLKKP